MRFIFTLAFWAALGAPAISQTSTEKAEASVAEQVRMDAFQSHRRADSYGIADFVIVNGTDKPLNSIELTCWTDQDRARATRVLVWPTPGAVPAHKSQQFSNVNIGIVGAESRSECEVTGAE